MGVQDAKLEDTPATPASPWPVAADTPTAPAFTLVDDSPAILTAANPLGRRPSVLVPRQVSLGLPPTPECSAVLGYDETAVEATTPRSDSNGQCGDLEFDPLTPDGKKPLPAQLFVWPTGDSVCKDRPEGESASPLATPFCTPQNAPATKLHTAVCPFAPTKPSIQTEVEDAKLCDTSPSDGIPSTPGSPLPTSADTPTTCANTFADDSPALMVACALGRRLSILLPRRMSFSLAPAPECSPLLMDDRVDAVVDSQDVPTPATPLCTPQSAISAESCAGVCPFAPTKPSIRSLAEDAKLSDISPSSEAPADPAGFCPVAAGVPTAHAFTFVDDSPAIMAARAFGRRLSVLVPRRMSFSFPPTPECSVLPSEEGSAVEARVPCLDHHVEDTVPLPASRFVWPSGSELHEDVLGRKAPFVPTISADIALFAECPECPHVNRGQMQPLAVTDAAVGPLDVSTRPLCTPVDAITTEMRTKVCPCAPTKPAIRTKVDDAKFGDTPATPASPWTDAGTPTAHAFTFADDSPALVAARALGRRLSVLLPRRMSFSLPPTPECSALPSEDGAPVVVTTPSPDCCGTNEPVLLPAGRFVWPQ